MLNIQQIKKILQENNIAVLKKFGQNFLISESVLNKIIKTANIKPQDTILEIGPGLGVLTFELAKRAGKVIAIEKDRKMAEILQKKIVEQNIKNIEVINEDALVLGSCRYPIPTTSQNRIPKKLSVSDFYGSPKSDTDNFNYKLISNLPYNIATAIIMKFLESENPPQQIVVMVQKEVAQRIVAVPPKMNKLAIFCQLYAEPKIICLVPPSAFYPKPKVDSAILQLVSPSPKSDFVGCRYPILGSHKNRIPTTFTNIVNLGFSHPRKTLLNNFAEPWAPHISKEKISQWLLQSNINPNQRAESLSLEQWQVLAKQYPQDS